jgi:hypothetical protein
MRYKHLVNKKITELTNLITGQESMISRLRPPEELKANLQNLRYKIEEVQVLINTEQETL